MIDSFSKDYYFLSNFYPSPVKYGGIIYPSVENAYQSAKSNDIKHRKALRTCSAKESKRRGRSVELRPDWENIKLGVMRKLLKRKFKSKKLCLMLLATGDQELVEGNWWGDTYWGVCRGQGQNNLGKLLMEIRNEKKALHTNRD